jgi:hypothetical protein
MFGFRFGGWLCCGRQLHELTFRLQILMQLLMNLCVWMSLCQTNKVSCSFRLSEP